MTPMTDRNRTIALLGGLALVLLITAAILYAALAGRPLDSFMPTLLGFATPTIVALLSAAGVRTDLHKVKETVAEVHEQVNGNYASVVTENRRLHNVIEEIAADTTGFPVIDPADLEAGDRPTPSSAKHRKDDPMPVTPYTDLHATSAAPVELIAQTAPTEVVADTARRTISGLAVPYNVSGHPSSGPATIAAGAIGLPSDLKRVKLFRDHRRPDGSGQPVGWLTGVENTDAGLRCTFKVADGPEGDQALADAAGVRDGLSVELTDVTRDGVTVTAASLAAVALVAVPAFADARVETISAAAAPGAPIPPAPAPAAAPAVPPVIAPAPAPAATAPAGLIYATARPAPLTFDRVAEVVTAIAQGRTDADLHAALADIKRSEHAWVSQEGWLGELWSGVDYQRTIVPLLGTKPLNHWRISGWRWKTKPQVADYAGDKAEIPTNTVETETVDAEAKRLAGGHDLDRKFFDFGDTEFVASYFRAMAESYALQTDQKAAASIVAAAFDGGTAPDLLRAVAKARFIVKRGARTNPTFVLMGDDTMQTLLDYGQFDVPAFLAQLGIDPRNFTSSEIVPEGEVFVGARQALDFYELPGSPIRVQAEHVAHGGRDAALFGYWGTLLHSTAGVVRVRIADAGTTAP
ncbi:major capsid and capsid maturation protease [Gordonia phage SallySpecial]|uniref:Major capsid and capsid maturation protease n=1 Tax=Gordonia phage SallySpecial TaxID=2079570 RepID=A0A2P1CC14_9CAUD|nr:major head protein [Gordonia phage SallySpecial]AVJ48756.1 major capsid and capsid maturation protease [Gordonia phage SallySpecial]